MSHNWRALIYKTISFFLKSAMTSFWLFVLKTLTTTPTTTHMLMKDRLSPSLSMRKGQSDSLIPPEMVFAFSADAQGLQPGAIKLSIFWTLCPTTDCQLSLNKHTNQITNEKPQDEVLRSLFPLPSVQEIWGFDPRKINRTSATIKKALFL